MEVGEVVVKITGDTSSLVAAMDQAQSKAEDLADTVSQPMNMNVDTGGAQTSIADIAAGIMTATALTAAFQQAVQACTAAIQSWAGFSANFDEIERYAGLSEEAVVKLNDSMRENSLVTGIATEKYQTYAEAAAKLGDKSSDGILKATTAMGEFGLISGASEAQITAMYTSLHRVYGMSLEDIGKYGAGIMGLTTKLGISETKILGAVEANAAFNEAMGESPEKAAAWAASLESAGLDASSTMQRSYIEIQTAMTKIDELYGKANETKVTKGKKGASDTVQYSDAAMAAQAGLKKIEDIWGMSGETLKKGMSDDYIGTLMMMSEKISNMSDKTEAFDAVRTLFSARTAKDMLLMGTATGTYNESLKQMGQINENVADSQDLLAKKQDDLAYKFELANRTSEEMSRGLGEILEPATREALKGFMALGAGVIEVERALKSGDWSGVGSMIKNAFTGVFDSFMTFDVGAFISGISEKIQGALTTLGDIGTWISSSMGSIDWSAVWGKVGDIGSSLVNAISGLKIGSLIGSAVFGAIDLGASLLKAITSAVAAINWSDVGDMFVGLVETAFDIGVGIQNAAVEWASSGGPAGVASAIGAAIGTALGALGNIGAKLIAALAAYFTRGGPALATGLKTGLETMVPAAISAMSALGGSMMAALSSAIGGIKTTLTPLQNQLMDLGASIEKAFLGAAVSVLKSIQSIGEGISSFVSAASSALGNLGSTFSSIASSVGDKLGIGGGSGDDGSGGINGDGFIPGGSGITMGPSSNSAGLNTSVTSRQWGKGTLFANDELVYKYAKENNLPIYDAKGNVLYSPDKQSQNYASSIGVNYGNSGYKSSNGGYGGAMGADYGSKTASTTNGLSSTWNPDAPGDGRYEYPDGTIATFPGEEGKQKVPPNLWDTSGTDARIKKAAAQKVADDKVKEEQRTYEKANPSRSSTPSASMPGIEAPNLTFLDKFIASLEAKQAGVQADWDKGKWVAEAATAFKEEVKTAATDFGTTITADDMLAEFKDKLGVGAKQLSSSVADGAETAGEKTVSYGQQAGEALGLGAQVASRFFNDAVNPVAYYINSAGQNVAVIGQVAQQQAINNGQVLTSTMAQSALLHANTMGLSASQFKGMMATSGDAWMLSGRSAAAYQGASATAQQASLTAGASAVGAGCSMGSSTIQSGMESGTNAFETAGGNVANALNSCAGNLMSAGAMIQGGGGRAIQGPSMRDGSFYSNRGGRSGSSGGSGINLGGADANGNFMDVTCLGNTVLVNGLKYTSPSGYTSYINPLTYADNGGISWYQNAQSYNSRYGSGGYDNSGAVSSGSTGGWGSFYGLSAQGALIDGPSRIIAGEAGRELVLPNPITETILGMVGQVQGTNAREPLQINVVNRVYLDGQEVTNTLMTNAVNEIQRNGLKTH